MARYDRGWFKHYRIPEDHWLWKDPKARLLWFDLLSMATNRPSKVLSGGNLEVLKPGTVITSRSELAQLTQYGEMVVRRCINMFKTDQMIDLKTTKYGTTIYLRNWDKFQSTKNEDNQQTSSEPSNEQPTGNQPATNEQPLNGEIKKERKEIPLQKNQEEEPPVAPAPGKVKKKKEISVEEKTARRNTSEAYKLCFQSRYGTIPILGAKDHVSIARIVDSVGQGEAPFLVKFYIECTDEYLINQCHPLTALASNVNQYVVRMKNGQTHRERLGLFNNKKKNGLTDEDLQQIVDGCLK